MCAKNVGEIEPWQTRKDFLDVFMSSFRALYLLSNFVAKKISILEFAFFVKLAQGLFPVHIFAIFFCFPVCFLFLEILNQL
jgi:hypothetical protein